MTVWRDSNVRRFSVLVVLVAALNAVAASAESSDRQKPDVKFKTEDGAVLLGPTSATGQRISGRRLGEGRPTERMGDSTTPITGRATARRPEA